jgi:hypothetical protein
LQRFLGVEFKQSLALEYQWSPSYNILGSNPGKEGPKGERQIKDLQRMKPHFFQQTPNRQGRLVEDPQKSGLRKTINHVRDTFPTENLTWAESILDESWAALHNRIPGPVFPPGIDLRQLPTIPKEQRPRKIVTGQYSFLECPPNQIPNLVHIINPTVRFHSTSFRGTKKN